jgi:RNA polymerase sigma factor (sigma-70 family)
MYSRHDDEKTARAEFETAVRETSTAVFSLSYRLTGSYDEARDLSQETFLKAWKSRGTLADKKKLVPWLRKICVNQYIDYYRKSKRENLVKDPVFPHMDYEITSNEPSPEDELIADEEIRLIQSQCWTIVTNTLPLYQQIVFILADVYRLTVSEISTIIERSPAATKSLLHRSRKAMANRLTPLCSIIQTDNICKCKSWIRFAHDIRKRREFLQQMILEQINSKKKNETALKKLTSAFRNLPQHVPPRSWIDEMIKKFG